MIDIDEFTELCARLAEQVPPALLHQLNGGIIVSDRSPRSDTGPPGTVILGQYVVDPHLGRYIVIYYHAFARLYGDLGPERLAVRVQHTLLHEIRHHIESLAGVTDLISDDLDRLERMWRRHLGDR